MHGVGDPVGVVPGRGAARMLGTVGMLFLRRMRIGMSRQPVRRAFLVHPFAIGADIVLRRIGSPGSVE